MDVLKDITDGLRTSDEATNDEVTSDEDDQTDTDADRNHESRSPAAELDESSEPDRDDVHLCSFCETEFDAGRDDCPECDAKIVLRGAR